MPGTHVLVVEDDNLLRVMMVDLLKDAGYTVDDAESADAAERLIDKDGYKLLVTDIDMPGRHNGIALAEMFHAAKPACPILFVTGRPEVVARLRDAEMLTSTVAKPFSSENLVAMVRGILRKHRDLATARRD